MITVLSNLALRVPSNILSTLSRRLKNWQPILSWAGASTPILIIISNTPWDLTAFSMLLLIRGWRSSVSSTKICGLFFTSEDEYLLKFLSVCPAICFISAVSAEA